MEFTTAQITFRPGERPTIKQEIKASFAFSQRRGALEKSTDTYQKSNQGFSWLGVKTEPFDDWLETSFIEFCFPDEAYGDFIVCPVDRITQEGEWLWFPVSKVNGIDTLTERSSGLG